MKQDLWKHLYVGLALGTVICASGACNSHPLVGARPKVPVGNPPPPVLEDAGATVDAQENLASDGPDAQAGPDLRPTEPAADAADAATDRPLGLDGADARPDRPDMAIDVHDTSPDRSSSDLGTEGGLELVAWAQSSGGVPVRVVKQDQYVFLGDWNLNPRATISNDEGSIESYDVTDVLHPTLLSAVSTPGHEVQDLALDGPWLFVANDAFGLRLVDASHPDALASITNRANGSLYATSVAVSVRGTGTQKQRYVMVGYLYGGALDIHAVPDGGPIPDPIHYSSSALPSRCDVHRIQVRGDLAYILVGDGATQGCIEILDLTQLPAVPTALGRYCFAFADFGSIGDIQLAGSLLFFSASDYHTKSRAGGLRIISVQDAKQPELVGSLDLANVGAIDWKGSGLAIGRKGEVFFMTSTGVQIIDVSDATKPVARDFALFPKDFGVCQGGTAVFDSDLLYVGAYCQATSGQGGLAIYRRH